jgi:uncharacterized iron-regulated membrane protein
MFASFRAAMTFLHTWFGLVLGFVLAVVFFFGSLSVFDREIDRYVVPDSRFEPQPLPSFDTVLRPVFERLEPDADELEHASERVGAKLDGKTLPVLTFSAYTTHRDPVLSLYAEFAVKNPNDPSDHVHGHVTIDPRNGRELPELLNVGSDFLYPMHYSLHLHWLDLGAWLVGLAGLVMLVALVSGVVVHRKLFGEFFTFRANKAGQRRTLDLHNLTGVVALPFHFMFALTGLIVFAGFYLPISETALKPLARQHEVTEASTRGLAFEPAGRPAALASVDAMVLEAKRRWSARGMPGEVGFLSVQHVGDVNAYVSIYRAGSDRVTLVGQAVHFAGPTGRVIHEEPPPSVVSSINEFLTGLHLQHFEHWLLRWLYLLGGLSGCACIATGLVFFVEKRKQREPALARWVDALAIGTVTGTLVATAVLFVASLALPRELADRGAWQERTFFSAWLASFAHAAWRSSPARAGLSPAWREQCYAVSFFALSAVVLNALVTGDHLGKTLARGYWPVAGVDLTLLAVATACLLCAEWLRRRALPGSSLDDAAHGEPRLETTANA